jgi:hypothetical protein
MANRYVNASGSEQVDSYGNWAIGSNAAAGTSPETAWATLDKVRASGSSTDTTILYGSVVSPVTYLSLNHADGTAANRYYNRPTILVASGGAGSVIIIGQNNPDSVIDTLAGATTFELRDIIIDGQDTIKYCLSATANGPKFIMRGTSTLRNFVRIGINTVGSIDLGGNWSINANSSYVSGSTPFAGINTTVGLANQTFVAAGTGIINITNTAASGTIYGIKLGTTGTDTIGGYSIDINSTSGTTAITVTGTQSGVVPKGLFTGDTNAGGTTGTPSSLIVKDVTINTAGPNTAPTGAEFCGSRTTNIATNPCTIERVKATHTGSTPTTGGHGVMIGNDNASIALLPITITSFADCTCTNYWHGIMVGNISGVSGTDSVYKVLRPTSYETNLGVHFKNATSIASYGGYHVNPRETALRFKGSTNCSHNNHTIVVDKVIASIEGVLVANNDAGPTSSGNTFKNNNVYLVAGAKVGTICKVFTDSVGSVTFTTNNYYAVDGFATSCTVSFATSGATNVNSTDWLATYETTAQYLNPDMLGISGRLRSTTPLLNLGSSIIAGTLDHLQNPYRTPPTVGGFEYINGGGSGSGNGLLDNKITS